MSENVIEFIKNEKRATVTFSQERFKIKIRKLAEMYPDEVEIIADKDNDEYLYAHIPVKYIRIQRPRQVELTDEEREILVERLKQIRDKKKNRKTAEDVASISKEELEEELGEPDDETPQEKGGSDGRFIGEEI